ncbi:uncharacterized protein N7511_009616 [Penicillium nucicola]|uniref:uncharacterized protein n=1 Tax=Penicillium nucicola TaxID=1850975 RepID=UPI00254524D8|nr:uncharacterized protein N7511_009616 [Penicillium nucicola]KAJ5747920.1 hypothetical protein N7511_009616 [Penicillium nucicola]
MTKAVTPVAHSVDESSDIEANMPIQGPRPLYHSRFGSRAPRRWTGYTDRRFQPVHVDKYMSDYPFASYQIPETTALGTINHMPPLPVPQHPATNIPATPLATAFTPEAPRD